MGFKKGFFITMLVVFLITFSISTVFAQTNGIKESHENYTYILKDSDNTNKVFKDIKELYPDMTVNLIEEIGIITIDLGEEKEQKNKIKKISAKINSFIEEEGEMPELIVPKDPISMSQNKLEAHQNSNINTNPSIIPARNTQNFPELTSEYFTPFNWYLEDITNNFESETINKKGSSTIALIDSGIDLDHPLLRNKVDLKLAKNYVDDNSSIYDEQGHGTQVAGIIASISSNSKIIPYKVLGKENGNSAWVIEAIIDAAKDGNDVINLSLGTYLSKSDKEDKMLIKAYDKAIKFAKKEGVVVVASAGNSSFNLDDLKKDKKFHLPGGSQHLITVSSNSKEDTLTSYSNFGKTIDFSAPGGDLGLDFDITDMIITTYPSGGLNTDLDQLIGIPQGYTLSMGSSLATPQVSAAAAMVIAEHRAIYKKDLNTNQVKKYLKEGSIDLGEKGKDIYFGEGKINIYNSLLEVQKKMILN